jgi:hypothetical protein
MVLSALGLARVCGFAFGLVARLHSLVWHGLGLRAYTWCLR